MWYILKTIFLTFAQNLSIKFVEIMTRVRGAVPIPLQEVGT